MPDVEDIAPTFFVLDVRRAMEWYGRVLGFQVTFLLEAPGEAASYCGLALGAATLHLARLEAVLPGVRSKGACYLRLRSGVDEYVSRIVATGHPLTSPLKDQHYGMREATVRDLDGNDVYIGQPLKESVA